jgi:hypothetical protein
MFKRIIIILLSVVTLWLLLTIWAESNGGKKTFVLGTSSNSKKALIIYDPDPFYNLDEQVCRSFGTSLAENNFYVHICTVAAATNLKDSSFDLYVFCANTYNDRPDWAVSNYIRKAVNIKEKPVVAITLGAGSTALSKKALDRLIYVNGGKLIASRVFWLFRPNDETRSKDSNVKVARSMCYDWGKKIALKFNDTSATVGSSYTKN